MTSRIGAILVVAVAMSYSVSATKSEPIASSTHELTTKNSEIALPDNKEVNIKIPRSEGTGYSWKAKTLSDNVSVIFSGTVRADDQKGDSGRIVGFPVYDVFKISRSGPGPAQVLFNLSRVRGEPTDTRTLIVQ
jgi:predicted secreted protein